MSNVRYISNLARGFSYELLANAKLKRDNDPGGISDGPVPSPAPPLLPGNGALYQIKLSGQLLRDSISIPLFLDRFTGILQIDPLPEYYLGAISAHLEGGLRACTGGDGTAVAEVYSGGVLRDTYEEVWEELTIEQCSGSFKHEFDPSIGKQYHETGGGYARFIAVHEGGGTSCNLCKDLKYNATFAVRLIDTASTAVTVDLSDPDVLEVLLIEDV